MCSSCRPAQVPDSVDAPSSVAVFCSSLAAVLASFAAVAWLLMIMEYRQQISMLHEDTLFFFVVGAGVSSFAAIFFGIFGFILAKKNQKNVKNASLTSTLIGIVGTSMCCVCPCYACCTEPCGCGGPACVVHDPMMASVAMGATGVTGSANAGRSGSVRMGDAFSHHPDDPRFDEDVFRVGTFRFCVGCFTVYPAFVLVLVALPWFVGFLSWGYWILMGFVAAGFQLFSVAGLARQRWSKMVVKSLLGGGLALVVVGVSVGPWPVTVKWGFLVALLWASLATAIPRQRRLRKFIHEQANEHMVPYGED